VEQEIVAGSALSARSAAGIMPLMTDPSETPPPEPSPLVARAEQVVLVVLALAVVAGVAWRAADYWRIGAEPIDVVPPPEGPTFRINVNSADWVTLSLVPGVGEKMAKAIVEERQKQGGKFESLDDLLEVKGIGAKMLEKLHPYLSLGNPDADGEPVEMVDVP
jgi:competence ComEA-like helix-hairpin-helix protein